MSDDSTIYVGIDPGAANTGVVAIDCSNSVLVARHIKIERSFSGVVCDYERVRKLRKRLVSVFSSLWFWFSDYSGDCVFSVEGPSFNRFATGSIETGMLHCAVYGAIDDFSASLYDHADTITVPPKTLKKFVSGNGNATKATMAMAIRDRWGLLGDEVFDSQDVCEAYALAQCGKAIITGGSGLESKVLCARTNGDGYTEVDCRELGRGCSSLQLDTDSSR